MHRNESANMGDDGLFPSQPPLAVITPEFVNSIQEELMNVVEQSGAPILTQDNDTRTQLWEAIRAMALRYDYIVDTQATFVNLFTRTGANSYDINADYKSVYFKHIDGGYKMSNVFSGGDTWGDILTKNCKHLEFESGTYIDFANAKGNITVETDDCYLKNVEIKGAGTVASGIIESFKLNAYRVTFDNCKCNTRLSNVDMVGFQGSATALHNITSKYINCTAYDLDGSDKIYGFKDCMNLSNCVAYQLDSSSGTDVCYGFHSCAQISNCYAYDIDSDSGSSYGYASCNQLSSCHANDLVSVSGNAIGFSTSDQISACYAYNISGSIAIGFNATNQISGCHARNIVSTSNYANGFNNSNQISACYAYNIDSTSGTGDASGFDSCEQISACQAEQVVADSGDASGFSNCFRLSACYTTDIDSVTGTANGFENSNYGAALNTTEPLNANNDWMDTNDAQITNQFSTGAFWT